MHHGPTSFLPSVDVHRSRATHVLFDFSCEGSEIQGTEDIAVRFLPFGSVRALFSDTNGTTKQLKTHWQRHSSYYISR